MNSQPDKGSDITGVNDEQRSSRTELIRAAWGRLFGYDFFISYAWKDGRPYAENLCKALASKPLCYRCFIDSKEMGGGLEWRRSVRKALAQSKVLVLIGSEYGLKRDAVFEEIREFSTSRRPLIPIDISARITNLASDHRLYPLLEQRLRIDEVGGDSALSHGKPSRDVVDFCHSSFGFVRIDRIRTRVLGMLIAVLTILVLWAFLASIQARNQRTNALKRLSENLVTQGFALAENSKDADALLMFTEAMGVDPDPDRIRDVHRWRISSWAGRVAAPEHTFIHGAEVIATYFNADGRLLVTGTQEGKATVWNVETEETVFDRAIEFNCTLGVAALAFNQRDGLLAAGHGTNLEVWDIKSGVRRYGPFQNDTQIVGLDLDPNGGLAVSVTSVTTNNGGSTSRCYKWDLNTGERIQLPYNSDEPVLQRIQISPDGNLILGMSNADDIIRIWDAKSEKRLLEPGIKGEGSHYFYHAGFSPDGTRIVTGGLCKSACIWQASTGKLLVGPLTHGKDAEGADTVQSAAFSLDGKRVATAGHDNMVRVWNAATGDPLSGPIAHGKFATQVSFSPDPEGKWLLTSSQDEIARVWEAESGKPVTPVLIHSGSVDAAAFSPDGSHVVTGSRDGIARIWKITPPSVLVAPEKHSQTVFHTSFSRDGKLVLTGGGDGSVTLWDLASGRSKSLAVPLENSLTYAGFSQDEQRILTISGKGTFQTFDLDGKPMSKPVETDTPGAWVTSGSFSSFGKRVVIGLSDGTAQVFDQEGNKIQSPFIHAQRSDADNSVKYTCFSPCERYVTTLANDGYARIWDCDNGGKPVATLLHEENASLGFAAFDLSGEYLVTVGGNAAKAWKWKTGEAIGKKLTHEKGDVWRAAFSPDGKRIITASFDKSARIWDTQTSEPVGRPLIHEGRVRVAQFSSDGSRVLTASEDGVVRLWDAESGSAISPEYRHRGGIWSGALSQDGLSVAIGGEDGVVKLWKLTHDSRPIDGLRDQYSFAACRRVDMQGGLVALSPSEIKALAVKLNAGNAP
jgi:WD40 repeat protein